jgi:hypothetical protein
MLFIKHLFHYDYALPICKILSIPKEREEVLYIFVERKRRTRYAMNGRRKETKERKKEAQLPC